MVRREEIWFEFVCMYASTDGATYNFAQDVVQIEKIMEVQLMTNIFILF